MFSTKTYTIYIFSTLSLIILCYFTIDKEVSLYFIDHSTIFKHIGKKISMLGESHWYIIIAILGALYFAFVEKNRLYMHRFLFLLYANLFSGLISLVSKLFFGKLRPWKLENNGDGFGFLFFQNPDFTFLQNINYQATMLLKNSTHYTSFPSGHSTTTIAVFTYMVLLFPKYTYVWFMVALVGLSGRILANDHFISDILAGALVGSLATLYIYNKMKEKLVKNS